MAKYKLAGTFKMGDKLNQPFNIEIDAKDEKSAHDLLYTILGSKHNCPRRFIKITKGKTEKPAGKTKAVEKSA